VRDKMRALLPVEGEEHGKAVVCVSIGESGKSESLSRGETSSAPLILLLDTEKEQHLLDSYICVTG